MNNKIMMFKTLKNIESSFRFIRTLAIIVVIASISLCIYIHFSSLSQIAKEREKIYVLDSGKSLMLALSQDMSQNRPTEAKNHVRLFHELFFTLSPDPEAINFNIKRSLFLADKSAYDYYTDLKEADYYRRLISTNTLQLIHVELDSITVNFDSYPYEVTTKAQQTIIRESNITKRSLTTIGQLENCTRSENNPHGFMLTKFMVLKNDNISTQKR